MSGLFVLAREASDMEFATTRGQAYKNDIGSTVPSPKTQLPAKEGETHEQATTD